MIILGLTGSMAMGKSTVSKMLKQIYHVPVWDADQVVRELLENDAELITEIAALYPEVMCGDKVDRRVLRSRAFDDSACLDTLERLIHGRAFREALTFLKKMERFRMPVCVLDVPLLFEVGWDRVCTHTLLVYAPPYIQLQRIHRRPDLSASKIDHILSRQLPLQIKKQLATFTIQTGLSKRFTFDQVRRMMRRILP